MSEDYARLLLIGLDALPFRERWLLCWLLDRPARQSIAFESMSGMDAAEFCAMCARWRELGLIRNAFNDEHDAVLPQATDFAAMIAGLVPAEPPYVFSGRLLDLDEMELAA